MLLDSFNIDSHHLNKLGAAQLTDGSSFSAQPVACAFVLMQYLGYLHRNPNDAPEPGLNFDGYNFWLTKLDQFNGNFTDAEMVKAFITSTHTMRLARACSSNLRFSRSTKRGS
jgi:hypothetical protein